ARVVVPVWFILRLLKSR
ncbi:MAG: DUF6460 domain-containing protein, partial [Bosea sp. (in: a-proteobacteria)]